MEKIKGYLGDANICYPGYLIKFIISNSNKKILSEWYITSLFSIYGGSHDYARVIFKLR
jgi:hypothetical protein